VWQHVFPRVLGVYTSIRINTKHSSRIGLCCFAWFGACGVPVRALTRARELLLDYLVFMAQPNTCRNVCVCQTGTSPTSVVKVLVHLLFFAATDTGGLSGLILNLKYTHLILPSCERAVVTAAAESLSPKRP
jgi:hypothetical protein